MHFEKFRLAIAGDTGNADDLTGAHVERHIVNAGYALSWSFSVRFLTSSTVLPGLALPFLTRSSTRRPTISSASSSTIGILGLAGRHQFAAAHHRHAIGDRHDLAQLVGDEDDGLALVLELPQNAEQMIGFVRREHAGRLVEDQDLGALEQRFEDFDALLQADRQVADDGVGIDVELIVAGKPLELGPRLGQRRADEHRRLRRRARHFPGR